MKTITLGEQLTIDGARVPMRRNVFDGPSIEDLRAHIEDARVKCWTCDQERHPRQMYAAEVFDDPWQDAGTTIHVCKYTEHGYGATCYDGLTDTGITDFGYFDCEGCNRLVIVRCPSNGWHSYQREVEDEDGDLVGLECLRCYERALFEDGAPRAAFEAGRLPGMFCEPDELRAHGFEVVPGFDDYFVRGSAETVCAEAIRLIDEGARVIVDYERLSLLGNEGRVTLWQKPPFQIPQPGAFGEAILTAHPVPAP